MHAAQNVNVNVNVDVNVNVKVNVNVTETRRAHSARPHLLHSSFVRQCFVDLLVRWLVAWTILGLLAWSFDESGKKTNLSKYKENTTRKAQGHICYIVRLFASVLLTSWFVGLWLERDLACWPDCSMNLAKRRTYRNTKKTQRERHNH